MKCRFENHTRLVAVVTIAWEETYLIHRLPWPRGSRDLQAAKNEQQTRRFFFFPLVENNHNSVHPTNIFKSDWTALFF